MILFLNRNQPQQGAPNRNPARKSNGHEKAQNAQGIVW
jgi:hypothetical protein